MGPIWDIDRDLRSAQLREGLGIQNKQESTFLLETDTEEEDYVIGRGKKKVTDLPSCYNDTESTKAFVFSHA